MKRKIEQELLDVAMILLECSKGAQVIRPDDMKNLANTMAEAYRTVVGMQMQAGIDRAAIDALTEENARLIDEIENMKIDILRLRGV